LTVESRTETSFKTTDLSTSHASAVVIVGGLAVAGVLVSLVGGGNIVRTSVYFGSAFLGLWIYTSVVSSAWLRFSKRAPRVDSLPPGTTVVIVRSLRSLLIERWRSELWFVASGLIGPYLLLGSFFVAALAGAGIAGLLGMRPIYEEMKSFERRNNCELLVKIRPRARFWGAQFYVRKLAL
jgi:hypothetical protein